MTIENHPPIDLDAPIIPSGHFTWREAVTSKTGGIQEIPNEVVYHNIIKLAKYMEVVRKLCGNKPITITSWYRTPRLNSMVGGKPNSLHLTGLAADFFVKGQSPRETQRILANHHGGLGYGKTFTHVDLGRNRRWTY